MMNLKFSIGTIAGFVLLLSLGGCMSAPSDSPNGPEPGDAPASTGEQLYDEAKARYLPYKTRVNSAQREVFDGEWQITTYGDFPQMCQSEVGQRDDTYQFVTSVHLTDATEVIGDNLPETASGLADRLEADGWSNVQVTDISSERTESVTVQASDSSQHVDLLMVSFDGGLDGEHPMITLTASSDCGNGRSLDLVDMMFPDVDLPDEPTTMVPEGPVRFGFDETGQPVMLDGAAE